MKDDEILKIVRQHVERYPKLQCEDLVKLVFQNSFGPAHMNLDPARTLAYLKEEYKTVSYDPDAMAQEDIGNGLVRVHLSSVRDESALEQLNRRFVDTADAFRGSEADFIGKLGLITECFDEFGFDFTRDVFKSFLEAYFANGIHAISHSETFRKLYHPSYRVVYRAGNLDF